MRALGFLADMHILRSGGKKGKKPHLLSKYSFADVHIDLLILSSQFCQAG